MTDVMVCKTKQWSCQSREAVVIKTKSNLQNFNKIVPSIKQHSWQAAGLNFCTSIKKKKKSGEGAPFCLYDEFNHKHLCIIVNYYNFQQDPTLAIEVV